MINLCTSIKQYSTMVTFKKKEIYRAFEGLVILAILRIASRLETLVTETLLTIKKEDNTLVRKKC
jgi:hypothetical protein